MALDKMTTTPVLDPEIYQQKLEWERIKKETAIEREWWPEETKFMDEEDEQVGLGRGKLVKVPRDGEGWRLIGVLNGTINGEPNTVRPQALALLNTLIGEWQQDLGGPGEEVAAAVTSLYRGLRHQRQMDKNLALRNTDSSHLAGAAIDISLRSYYVRQKGEDWKGVNSWSGEQSYFKPEYAEKLVETVGKFKAAGLCNAVIENRVVGGRLEPTVLHVCVNPAYEPPK